VPGNLAWRYCLSIDGLFVMDITTIGLLTIIGMLFFMMMGVPIAYSLGFCGLVAGLVAYGGGCLPKLGWTPYFFLFNQSWTPLPLFVLLGTIVGETGIGKDLFKAAMNWLSRVRGGLVVAGVMGEAAMASVIGTSAATVIVVGKVAVPEFERYGYNRKLGLGALLAGGVLGPLIPPSATMIVYSVLAELSLGRLFIAGIIPGILLAIMLSLPVILICTLKPEFGPPTGSVSWRERFSSLKRIWPVVFVMLCILGSIYLGIATPTEAAGFGCVIVIIIAVVFFGLRWDGMRSSMIEAVVVNSMIMLILVGGSYFTYMIGSANIAKYLYNVVEVFGLAPWQVILSINFILLVLGCLIDPLTITLLTVPIFVPLILQVGFDPLWFGVVFVINTQIGLITPPMGIDLFAIKTIFDIPTGEILRGVTPFLIVELIFLAIIIAFPDISLWLPGTMMGK
jgi:C4-dicarboxylate transporter DctM subunit